MASLPLMTDDAAPLRVYGSEISYFTGKLEGYLRYKEIPYERVAMKNPFKLVRRTTGINQIPAVELPDGRWMTDTTPIIAWLESQVPEPAVIPRDPLQAFFSLLLEDYGDEWLWRPAMHYRWHYRGDATLLSRKIVDELAPPLPLPDAVKRFAIRSRQGLLFLRRDGVCERTRPHVEGIYRKTLDQLQAIFAERPFLLGDVPTVADFGLFASMFRHFGMDPTPATIMRETAPDAYAWVARVWNARASHTRGTIIAGIPPDWGPILDEIGTAYLPHLAANAQAWKNGSKHFEVDIQGTSYQQLRTARYRVWCLEELRRHYQELAEGPREEARALLEKHSCWEPLWRVAEPNSGIDPERVAPFGPGYSMTGL